MSEEKGEEKFDIVAFVISAGIWMGCWILSGLTLKAIPPMASGLAILVGPAPMHIIGLGLSIYKNKTESAIILGIFSTFWLFNGIGLICLPSADINKTLILMEPAIFILIPFFQDFYKEKKEIRIILIWLAITVLYSWLTKIGLFAQLGETNVGITVAIALLTLGFGSLVVVRRQLKKRQKTQS